MIFRHLLFLNILFIKYCRFVILQKTILFPIPSILIQIYFLTTMFSFFLNNNINATNLDETIDENINFQPFLEEESSTPTHNNATTSNGHFRQHVDDLEDGSPSKAKDIVVTPLIQLTSSKGGFSSDPKCEENNENGKVHEQTQSSSTSSSAISTCINYSFCSVSMILVNKSLASRYALTTFR